MIKPEERCQPESDGVYGFPCGIYREILSRVIRMRIKLMITAGYICTTHVPTSVPQSLLLLFDVQVRVTVTESHGLEQDRIWPRF